MRVGVLGCAILVSVAVFGGAVIASAGTCGGVVPCQCGDTVTADYAMTHDLGPCPGHGLVVRSNVTLDCRGFGLVGLGNGSEQYGVYLTVSESDFATGSPGVLVGIVSGRAAHRIDNFSASVP